MHPQLTNKTVFKYVYRLDKRVILAKFTMQYQVKMQFKQAF